MKPVPVLLSTQLLSGGGTERQLVEVAKALDPALFEPHVVCYHGDAVKQAELHAAGVKFFELPLRSFAKPATIGHGRTLARYIQNNGIQIYHAFDMPAAIFGVPVARMARVPVVLSSVRGHRDLYTPFHQRLLRLTDRMVDGIVANAGALVDHLAGLGVSPQLVALCRNGLDLSKFAPLAQSRDWTRQPITIGSLCLLRPEKNVETLLRAFAALPQRAQCRLRVTGSGPELPKLEALAAQLGLTPAEISFHPSTNDVASVLRDTDIFVLPSLSEGLSNSIMEAMAAGCAVAASSVGGNVELIQDRETGVLFAPKSVESLVEALRGLCADPAWRGRLAAAGARHAQEHFSMASSARTMEAIYRRHLEAKRIALCA